MANERPSARPSPGPWWKPDNGYWMANSGAGLPPDVWSEWLTNMLAGHDADSEMFPGAPSAFPGGQPQSGPSQSPYDNGFAGNALRMGQSGRQPSPQNALMNVLRMWGRQ